MSFWKDIFLLNTSENRVNPSTEDKQDTQIDAVGEPQETPTNTYSLLGRLKNLFTDGLAKLKIWDGTNVAEVNVNNSLKVTTYQPDGSQGTEITSVDYVSGKSGIDSSTETLQTITYPHHKVHSGNHFFVREYVDLPNGGNREYIIVTDNSTKWAHFLYHVVNEVEAEVVVTEGVSTSADGTAVSTFNNDRNSATSASTLIYHSPTGVTGGTVIADNRLGSSRDFGGEFRADNEWVLKQNTKYSINVINRTPGSSNLINTEFSWYEHTNKN